MSADAVTCDACGLPPHGEAADAAQGELPNGWYIRVFGRRRFRLCDCCGSIRHFKGGVSAYLQEALGLAPNAMCDFAASNEPGSGLHRLRIRAGASGPAQDATADLAATHQAPAPDGAKR
jgi:hypothetical protein